MLGTLSTPSFWIEVVAKTTLVLAVTAVFGRALRLRDAATRHLVRTAALASTLALPPLVLLAPRLDVAIATPAPQASRVLAPTAGAADPSGAALSAPRAGDPADARPRSDVGQAAGAGAETIAGAATRPTSGMRERSGLRPARVGAGVWAAGALAGLVALALSLARALSLLRRARPLADPALAEALRAIPLRRRVRLLASERVRVPMTLGLVRPVILVPLGFEGWSDERRSVVLLHELAHVKRLDWPIQLAGSMAASLWWFHPLALLAARGLRRDAEEAADDLVLAAGARPSSYAGHLVAIARVAGLGARGTLASVAMASSPLGGRVQAILDPRRRAGAGQGRRGVVALAPLVLGIVLLAAMRVTAAPPEPRERKPALEAERRAEEEAAAARRERKLAARERDGRVPRQGSEWFGKAHELHGEGQFDQAIEAWQKAIDLGYREDVAAYDIACAHARAGRPDEAVRWLRRARDEGFDLLEYVDRDSDLRSLRKDPAFHALVVEEQARAEAEGREVPPDPGIEAIRRLEVLEAKGSRNAEAFYEVGMELHRADRFDLAIRAWERVKSLGGRAEAATYNIACARSLAGDTKGALDALESAIELGFGDAETLDRDDDFDPIRKEARFRELRELARTLELPSDAGSWSLGKEAPRTSRAEWKEAGARYERYLETHPRSGRAWFDLGFARLRSSDPAGSAQAFERAYELGHRKATSAYDVACAHAQNGDRDRAFAWLEKAFAAGFEGGGTIAHDPDLDPIRDDPRFEAIEREHGEDWGKTFRKVWKWKWKHGAHHDAEGDEPDASDPEREDAPAERGSPR